MASQLQDEGTRSSLSDELRAATRQKHHVLNEHIIMRLPLCIPPQADSPVDYAKGIVVFSQIYFTFEEVLAMCQTLSDKRMRKMYQIIQLPQLLRTHRLRNDIAWMKLRLLRSEVEQLESYAEESKEFSQRIRGSLAERPHAMFAYTWTMYLALFNGGRWIRRQLVSAGSHFWPGEVLPLSFWDFGRAGHDIMDEDSLKDEFKAKFTEAASHLTDAERRDVVDETNRLFDLCSEMVEFLDKKQSSITTSTEMSPSRGYPSIKTFTETFRTCIAAAYTLLKTTAITPQKDKTQVDRPKSTILLNS